MNPAQEHYWRLISKACLTLCISSFRSLWSFLSHIQSIMKRWESSRLKGSFCMVHREQVSLRSLKNDLRLYVVILLAYVLCWCSVLLMCRQDSSGKGGGEPDVCHLPEGGGLRAYSEIPGWWSQTGARALQSGRGIRSVHCLHRWDWRYWHKEVSMTGFAHQGCICLIKNTVKTEILLNTIIVFSHRFLF